MGIRKLWQVATYIHYVRIDDNRLILANLITSVLIFEAKLFSTEW